YEAIDDGVLAKIVVPEGTQDVPVNELIAVLAQEGEDPKSAAAAAEKGIAPAPRIKAPEAAQKSDEAPKTTTSGGSPPSPQGGEGARRVQPQAPKAPQRGEGGG